MAHSTQTNQINKKYFILNYPLASSLIVLAALFHIWSGGSEFIGMQGYLSDFMAGKFPGSWWAERAALVIPLLLAVTIEFSFVALLRYLLNSLLYKTLWRKSIAQAVDTAYRAAMARYEAEKQQYEAAPEAYGLSCPEEPEKPDVEVLRIANITMYAMAMVAFAAVFAVSMIVSKKSIEYDTLVNGPEANVYSIDSLSQLESRQRAERYELLNGELQLARQAFRRDSLAIEAEYGGRIAAKQEKLNEYTIRERQSGRSLLRSRSIRRQQISELEAEKAEALIDRSARLQEQEAQIRERHQPALLALTTDFTARREQLQRDNERKIAANEARNAWFSAFLRRYAQLATVGQFLCWMYVILAFYVMGIRKQPRVRPESLESGLLADLGLLLYTAPTRLVHNWVRGLLSKVPPLYQMPGIGAVYDLDTLNEIAPLLEQLDKTKNWEEKQKLRRTINRKIAGYQFGAPAADPPADPTAAKVPATPGTTENAGPDATRSPGVDASSSTRSNGTADERRTTDVDRVATRDTADPAGVESVDSSGVDQDISTRRKDAPERFLNGDNKQHLDGTNTALAQQGRVAAPPASPFEVDIREQVILRAEYEGETREEQVEIRAVIDGIVVKGYYNEDYHPHAFFKKMKRNYEGYYRRQQRNMLTNLLRIELAERYMDLIERVGARHDLVVRDGG